MKKLILILTVFCLIFTFTCSVMAADATAYTYEFDGMTVTFAEDSPFTDSQRASIANYLHAGDDGATTYNLLCSWFGHSEQSGGVTTVTHCVLSTEPRCLEEHFDATICTRCEETLYLERIAYCYIYCCPVG